LFKKTFGETEFIVYLLFFLGGYITYADNNPNSTLPKNSPRRLLNKTRLEKIFIVSSGILMNFLISFLIIFSIGLIWKFIPVNHYNVSNINSNVVSSQQYVNNINSLKEYLRVYPKNEKIKNLRKTVLLNKEKTGFILVSNDEIKPDYYKVTSLKTLIKGSFIGFFNQFKVFYFFLTQFFSGKISVLDLRGLISIVRIGSDFMVNSQLYNTLWLIAFLSINMGISNLIPIPVLDGSKLFLLLLPSFSKKKVPIKPILLFIKIVYFLVVSFMLLLIFIDFIAIFRGVL
jgi:regulator of sigma E protease